MVDINYFRTLALSLNGVEEHPHFDMPSFRIKKKIFATYHPRTNHAMLRLSLVDQSVFCGYDGLVFFPVPGSWGAKGATFIVLSKVRKDMFKDALKAAYDYMKT